MLRKAKEMAEYVEDWIDCIEEARHGEHREEDDDDYEYSERGNTSMRMRGGRYGYRR